MEENLTALSFTCSNQMQPEAVNHMRQGILSFLLYLSTISSVCSGVVHRKAVRSQLQHITGQLQHITGQLQHITGQLQHITGQLQHITGQLGHFNKTGTVYF
jgi:peptidoglycan hydrolase CwlO-like protein